MSGELHLRHDGRSYDATFDVLDIGDLSTDAEVRQAAAQHFEVPASKLSNYSVDRAEGNITLRPQAEFGC